jgi:3-oxoacyl-[acyl-carrier protein] reductase
VAKSDPHLRLRDKVAVVTGAGAGIGRGIALRLAAEGAIVVATDVHGERLAETRRQLLEISDQAIGMELDVSSPHQVTRVYGEIVQRFARVDIQVSNAGIAERTPFLTTSVEQFERVLRINLTGVFLTGQAAAQAMVRSGGGRIVNISSVSGQAGGIGRAAYGSSKAGIINLTQTMALELAPYGVLVNAVAPGPTQVERTAHAPAQRDAFLNRMALKRYGTPEEMAAAVCFLCSDDANFITGHVLNVDGGFAAAGVLYDADKGELR